MALIDQTFGALYIFGSIGMVMYGISILQTYFYFLNYYDEGFRIKFLVVSVFLLDTAHSVFVAHSNYYYLISGFTHPGNLREGIWSLYASTAANVLINLFVKSYYIMQIHQLSKPRWRRWITPPMILLIIVHFGSGVETVAAFFLKGSLAQLKYTRPSSITLLATNLATDCVVAVMLCTLLQTRRSEYPESRVNVIISHLIIFCVERFILCLIIGVIQLVVLIVLVNTLYTAAIGIVFGKLYTNSLLATLNSRRSMGRSGVREGASTTNHITSYPLGTTRSKHTNVITTFSLDTDASRSAGEIGSFGLRTCDLEEGNISRDHKS